MWFLKKVFNRNKEELQMTEKGYLCADVLLKPIIWFSVFFANKLFDRIYLTIGDGRSRFEVVFCFFRNNMISIFLLGLCG